MKKEFPYRKILVVGCPGGGKSTFSRALAMEIGLPLYHLDMLNWRPDRTTVSREELDRQIAAILETEYWIIDGNYGRTQECRMDSADLVFFFDLPAEVCLAGVTARCGKVRPDMPWVEAPGESPDEEFLRSVRDFSSAPRENILARLAARPHLPVVTFRSHAEVDVYLEGL